MKRKAGEVKDSNLQVMSNKLKSSFLHLCIVAISLDKLTTWLEGGDRARQYDDTVTFQDVMDTCFGDGFHHLDYGKPTTTKTDDLLKIWK